jgi:hypothetical protein
MRQAYGQILRRSDKKVSFVFGSAGERTCCWTNDFASLNGRLPAEQSNEARDEDQVTPTIQLVVHTLVALRWF